jgi:hypothetical protein
MIAKVPTFTKLYLPLSGQVASGRASFLLTFAKSS